MNKANKPVITLMPITKPHTPPSRPSTPLASLAKEEKLSPLRAAAEKHAQSLGQSSYRPSTAQRAAAKEEAQRLLEKIKHLSSKAQQANKDEALDGPSPSAAEASYETADAAARPLTPSLRPSSALSSREFSLPRPSSRLGAGQGKEKGKDLTSASWSGPLPTGGFRPQSSRAATPRTPHRPMSRLGSSNPLRRSLPAMMAAAGEGSRTTTPWQSSTKVVAYLKDDPTPSTDIWINPAATTANQTSTQAASLAATTRNISPDRDRDRGKCVSTKRIEELTGRKNKIEDFEMTRGSLFAVFTELDSCKEGRITKSMLAEAGVRIGMSGSKIDEMFASLDKKGQGFLSLQDWGSMDMESQVRAFSKLYLQVTRGPSGKIKEEPISDLHSALAYAMGKLSIRETGRISRISHQKVLETFTFIDNNKSNTIDEQELADAFLAMGVNVTDSVIEQAMRTFDKDNSGSIDYFEFLSVLFPGLARMGRDARQDFS